MYLKKRKKRKMEMTTLGNKDVTVIINACLSISSLYRIFGNHLSFCSIEHTYEDGQEYFDLYDQNGFLVCCDGEICQVVSSGVSEVTLKSSDDKFFILTKEEFDGAVSKAA